MRYWVFTSKPGHFDMAAALIPGRSLDWPSFSKFKFEVGDLVFFYASEPVRQLIGKLEIERNDLPFDEADPRNDLRKWPMRFSKIPWLRLRVLQAAPVPFKPLQRGSLYYHTEFKPSPYPKLLHEGEIDYVLRAFDEAAVYDAHLETYEGGLDPRALERIGGSERLVQLAPTLPGGHITGLKFDGGRLSIDLADINGATLHIECSRIVRANWDFESASHAIAALRLTVSDTFLHLFIDGAALEILAKELSI